MDELGERFTLTLWDKVADEKMLIFAERKELADLHARIGRVLANRGPYAPDWRLVNENEAWIVAHPGAWRCEECGAVYALSQVAECPRHPRAGKWAPCSAECAARPGCRCPDYLALPAEERARLEGCDEAADVIRSLNRMARERLLAFKAAADDGEVYLGARDGQADTELEGHRLLKLDRSLTDLGRTVASFLAPVLV
jgi:hypothetical protein